jgi:hypothetical protein
MADLRYADQELKWHHADLPWSDAEARRYLESGSNACEVRSKRRYGAAALGFLADLDPLLGVSLRGSLPDDDAVFDLDELRCLILLNRAKRPLRLDRLRELEVLAFDDRPGVEAIARCPALKSLTIWSWAGADLSWLRGGQSVEYIKIEAKGQQFSLNGIQALTALRAGVFLDLTPADLVPLAEQRSLEYLRIEAKRGSPPANLDLAPLRGLTSLAWLTLRFVGSVDSVEPLRSLPLLRGVTLVGTDVRDGDMTPLIDLPPGATVSIDDRPHYSHSANEIDRARSASGRG